MTATKTSKSGCYKQVLLEYHTRLTQSAAICMKEIPILKVNIPKLEAQIQQILQCSNYASAEEYLIARVAKERWAVKRGEKLP